jgi:NAD(P)-dependent dehydrogenase (short-subunit alcohol dehydrogenase family)
VTSPRPIFSKEHPLSDTALNGTCSTGDAARPGAGKRVTGVPIADFDGRVAVVTGAGSGIGRGIAAALAGAGATVVVADIDLVAAQQVADELDAVAARIDVTDAQDLSKLARWVHETFDRVDILVNNAGVGPLDEFRSLTLADFRWVMDINFWGVVHGITAFLPYLEQNEHRAAILNTASMAAVLPNTGITAYGASKAAVLNLSDSLRAELAPAGHVGVTVLLPALVDTNITANATGRPDHDARTHETTDFLPPGRTITPEEVGALVVDGLRRGATHVFTHPETQQVLSIRHDDLLAAYDNESA